MLRISPPGYVLVVSPDIVRQSREQPRPGHDISTVELRMGAAVLSYQHRGIILIESLAGRTSNRHCAMRKRAVPDLMLLLSVQLPSLPSLESSANGPTAHQGLHRTVA